MADLSYCVTDSTARTVGSNSSGGERSPHRLLTTTIADELRLASNLRSKTIGLSLKDRSAIFPVGRFPSGAYWFDASTGGFITSTWYHDKLPAWLQQFNDRKLTEKYLSKPWELLLQKDAYRESMIDDNPYEGLLVGEENQCFRTTFLSLLHKTDLVYLGIHLWQHHIGDLAEAAIEAESLGQGDELDF